MGCSGRASAAARKASRSGTGLLSGRAGADWSLALIGVWEGPSYMMCKQCLLAIAEKQYRNCVSCQSELDYSRYISMNVELIDIQHEDRTDTYEACCF